MRHTALLLSVLIAFTAIAQDYLANDPVWRVHSVCAVPAPCIATDTYNYFTGGDSLINGIAWTKVLRQGSYTLGWQSPNPPDPNCQGVHPYGTAEYGVKLIRQEGRQLRIWADDADQLLYDFDLVVGSTVPLSWCNWSEDVSVVAVDSILIGTEMRARYELSNSWSQYLIEGVGSSHGLFEPLTDFFDCGYGLDCFGLGTEAYYPTAGGPSCSLIMTVDGTDVTAAWTFFPNPADHMVFISTDNLAAKPVVVRDMSSRVLVLERLSAGPSASLDVARLPDGCYALSIGDSAPRLLVVAH